VNNTGDLYIEKDILPLFDFTHNDLSKETLNKLLQEPLTLLSDILVRQDILKGFIANATNLKDYSYSRVDFYEVHKFLTGTSIETNKKGIRLKLFSSNEQRHQTKAKFIQFILLFQRLNSIYIKRLDTTYFPDEYKRKLQSLNNVFRSFNLGYYDGLIREEKFRIKHIIELAKLIASHQENGQVELFYKQLFLFESYLSISTCIVQNDFCFPSFSENCFSFENLSHPLLKNPVKNGFIIKHNVVLLTGPNMSGKSTFLKSVGLAVYLAHIGVGVPATKAELPHFDYISISINHNDDIQSGYSHFMVEVMRLKQVLIKASANKKCFAVFDELFKGTNIEDAVQISSQTINGFTRFLNSFFLISTHLHQLKEVERVKSEQVETYYLDCEIKEDIPVFKYVVRKGWSDLKVGQLLFEKEGLNKLLLANGSIE
jgi:DNA mismatch repair protein MutS